MKKKHLVYFLLLLCTNTLAQDFYVEKTNLYSSKKYPYEIIQLKRFGFQNHFLYNKKDLQTYKDSIEVLDKITSVVIELKTQVDIESVLNELIVLRNLKELKFESSFFLADNIKQKVFPSNISLLKKLETISLRGDPNWDINQLFLEFSKLKKLKNISFISFKNDLFLNKNLLKIKTLEGIHFNGGFGPKFPKNISTLKRLNTLVIQVNEYPSAKEELDKIKDISDLSINLYHDKSNEMNQIISQFNSLKRLFIAGKINNPESLFSSISKNKQLKELRIQNNKLIELPESIVQLKKLEKFYSSNNKFTKSLPDEFYSLKKLKYIEIQGSDITTISSKINQLIKLETLKLYYNKINNLPKRIGGLGKLKKLYLNNNQIENLPVDIGVLKISYLNLSNNKIKELPSSITRLINLDTLNIYDNRIIHLPKEIGNLKKLKKLNLNLNSLSYLPNSISDLKELKSLSINTNGIKLLPENFGKLTSLKTLNSEYNLLKELPESFGNLTSLKRLVLINNNLKKLPENFGELSQLTDLYLNNRENNSSVFQKYDHTKGRFINDTLKGFTVLKNEISVFPISFVRLKNLNTIELSFNKNIDSKQLFTLLKKSEATNYTLNLESCNIKELPISGWDSIKVKSLDLGNNEIPGIPRNLIKATYLTSINLNKNKGLNFNIRSKEELNILFAEMNYISFDELPKTNEMVRAYASLSNSKSSNKQFEVAVEYAKRAFAINKNLTYKFLHATDYIEALFYTKNYNEAIKLADIEIKKDTSRGMRILNSIIPNFNYKAKSQLALADTIQAIKTLEIVSKKFSGNQWSLISLLSKKIGKDSLAKTYSDNSITFYKNYLKNNEKDVGYNLSLLEAYIVNDKKKEAKSYFDSLIKLNIKDQNYVYLLHYFDIILNIDNSNFNEKYNLFKKELDIKKYSLRNWSFELLLTWNDFNNSSEKKEKIIKLTKLLNP